MYVESCTEYILYTRAILSISSNIKYLIYMKKKLNLSH